MIPLWKSPYDPFVEVSYLATRGATRGASGCSSALRATRGATRGLLVFLHYGLLLKLIN